MRAGFTTGSCAAAAAKAACIMLLTGSEKKTISIVTPKQIEYCTEILDINRTEKSVSCCVIKDSGDDPDVTNRARIYATVSFTEGGHNDNSGENCSENYVEIDGGVGVGRVTRPGLDQPVGNAAINRVPREMITKEIRQVCNVCDYKGAIRVVISVPEGEKLAQQTFNGRLGIVGGISILGTSGIVEPMSMQALIDTIKVEMKQKHEMGYKCVAVTPGNYGLDFMKKQYDYDLDKSVKCSNFIGDMIDIAQELGFEAVLLTGHIGKLIKVSGGIMNTHSSVSDGRMKLMHSAAIHVIEADKLKVASSDIDCILDMLTTEEALEKLIELGIMEKTMNRIIKLIMLHLNERAQGRLRMECIVYSSKYGLLAKSSGADELLKECKAYD